MTYETSNSKMEDNEVKDCVYITGTPDADGDAPFFRVGDKAWSRDVPQSEQPTVERITLQNDVYGEFCMRVRACVWVSSKLFFECPYHALTGVGYVP